MGKCDFGGCQAKNRPRFETLKQLDLNGIFFLPALLHVRRHLWLFRRRFRAQTALSWVPVCIMTSNAGCLEGWGLWQQWWWLKKGHFIRCRVLSDGLERGREYKYEYIECIGYRTRSQQLPRWRSTEWSVAQNYFICNAVSPRTIVILPFINKSPTKSQQKPGKFQQKPNKRYLNTKATNHRISK